MIKEYIEAKPYVRAALALVFYVRFGEVLLRRNSESTIDYWFNKADEFLLTFEQRGDK